MFFFFVVVVVVHFSYRIGQKYVSTCPKARFTCRFERLEGRGEREASIMEHPVEENKDYREGIGVRENLGLCPKQNKK